MELHGTQRSNPFLYLGLLFLAGAVFAGLLAENPNASEVTIVFLNTGSFLSIIAGVISLLLDPIKRVYKARHYHRTEYL